MATISASGSHGGEHVLLSGDEILCVGRAPFKRSRAAGALLGQERPDRHPEAQAPENGQKEEENKSAILAPDIRAKLLLSRGHHTSPRCRTYTGQSPRAIAPEPVSGGNRRRPRIIRLMSDNAILSDITSP